MERLKPILTVGDPWYALRQDCFGNVEPEVKLEGITMPIGYDNNDLATAQTCYDSETFGMEWGSVEILPALAAGTSYGSRDKLGIDPHRAFKLNKTLIKLGHHTPLEAIQLNFHVSGISKACGAQISRHRIGQGHVSASRRFQQQAPKFVYPMFAQVEAEYDVRSRYRVLSRIYREAFDWYNALRRVERGGYGFKKEDARLIMPVSTATERSWWINVRALRDFFRLRLAKDAEWEIRRLAQIMFNLCYTILPSLFEDIKEQFE